MTNTSISASPNSKNQSMSPLDFSKGLLAKLCEIKGPPVGFHSPVEKNAMTAVYEVFDTRVNSIKGNEAKSPRYRDLLRIRNTLQPGVMQEFGAFRHVVFQAMSELRKTHQEKGPHPLNAKVSALVLNTFSPDDISLIEACAKAYTVRIKAASK